MFSDLNVAPHVELCQHLVALVEHKVLEILQHQLLGPHQCYKIICFTWI